MFTDSSGSPRDEIFLFRVSCETITRYRVMSKLPSRWPIPVVCIIHSLPANPLVVVHIYVCTWKTWEVGYGECKTHSLKPPDWRRHSGRLKPLPGWSFDRSNQKACSSILSLTNILCKPSIHVLEAFAILNLPPPASSASNSYRSWGFLSRDQYHLGIDNLSDRSLACPSVALVVLSA